MKCHTVNKNVKETQKSDLLRQEVLKVERQGPNHEAFYM